jgi:hypothetical protein
MVFSLLQAIPNAHTYRLKYDPEPFAHPAELPHAYCFISTDRQLFVGDKLISHPQHKCILLLQPVFMS